MDNPRCLVDFDWCSQQVLRQQVALAVGGTERDAVSGLRMIPNQTIGNPAVGDFIQPDPALAKVVDAATREIDVFAMPQHHRCGLRPKP